MPWPRSCTSIERLGNPLQFYPFLGRHKALKMLNRPYILAETEHCNHSTIRLGTGQEQDDKYLQSDRAAFWYYCQRAVNSSKARARVRSVPWSLDAYYIDALLVDQRWRCAVSGVPLNPPKSRSRRDPFGPSLDRIVPA